MSYPKKKYFTPFDEAMSRMPESYHLQIIGYICGYQQRPDAALTEGIHSAGLEVGSIDISISCLGFCWFGKKRKAKRRLKREKSKWLNYISFLEEVMHFRHSSNLEESLALLKKHADITKFHPSIGKENHHE